MKKTSAPTFAAALLLSLLLVSLSGAPVRAAHRHQVLVLHSYHKGYLWTDNVMSGIEQVFSEEDPKTELTVEYMDTKRVDRDILFPELENLFLAKYEDNPPDVIIASDDNALDFILKYRDDIFPDVPVVFCGLNNYNEQLFTDQTGITGVVEDWDPEKTLDVALKLHPKTKGVVVISDATTTSARNLEAFKKAAVRTPGNYTFTYMAEVSAVELAAALANLEPGNIIMVLSFFRDKDGRVYTIKEGISLITEASGLPVYSFWDFNLGAGVVGGMLVSGVNQGVEAAKMADRILHGTPVDDIPIMHESPNQYMFDYNVLQRFKVSLDRLPPNSIVINRPVSFFDTHKKEIIILGSAVFVLALTALLMGLNIMYRRRAEQSLKESEQRYALVVQGANDGIWDWNLVTDEVYFSERYKKILGYKDDEFPNELDEWHKRIHPEDLDRIKEAHNDCLEGRSEHLEVEYRMYHKDGTSRWILGRATALFDENGTPYRMAGTHTDITRRKVMENQLRHLALHDPLTGLANRTLCRERIGRAMERSKRRKGYHYAVLFIDLDRFKVINDSLGHTLGDKLLAEVGDRLTRCIRSLDTAARYGGDEFVILLEEMDTLRMPVKAIRRIQESLSDPFILGDRKVRLSASIGVALRPLKSGDPEDILQNANIAMHRAKDSGRNRFKVFTPRMREHAMEIMALENDMDQGITRGEFFLNFQPIVHVDDEKRLYGFETLVRWHHPDRGMVMPGDFIQVAEETGKIIALGHWILRQACMQMALWAKTLPKARDYVLSVNVSAQQLAQSDFTSQLQKILEETGLDPAMLNLEITETALMESGLGTAGRLSEIKALGAALSIDDFGTGYSSMAYLSKMPLNHLKIDLSFVQGMDAHPENREIVRTIINLAHSLGLKVVAEGVEEPMHRDLLSRFECDYYQGYLCSRPVSLEEAEQMIRLGRPCP